MTATQINLAFLLSTCVSFYVGHQVNDVLTAQLSFFLSFLSVITVQSSWHALRGFWLSIPAGDPTADDLQTVVGQDTHKSIETAIQHPTIEELPAQKSIEATIQHQALDDLENIIKDFKLDIIKLRGTDDQLRFVLLEKLEPAILNRLRSTQPNVPAEEHLKTAALITRQLDSKFRANLITPYKSSRYTKNFSLYVACFDRFNQIVSDAKMSLYNLDQEPFPTSNTKPFDGKTNPVALSIMQFIFNINGTENRKFRSDHLNSDVIAGTKINPVIVRIIDPYSDARLTKDDVLNFSMQAKKINASSAVFAAFSEVSAEAVKACEDLNIEIWNIGRIHTELTIAASRREIPPVLYEARELINIIANGTVHIARLQTLEFEELHIRAMESFFSKAYVVIDRSAWRGWCLSS